MDDFIWEAIRHRPIGDARAGAASAKSAAEGAAKAYDRLALTSRAIWALVKERTGLTDDDLRERILQIDARDGTVDGRYRPPPKPCANCGKKTSATLHRCIYCGTTQAEIDPFPGA